MRKLFWALAAVLIGLAPNSIGTAAQTPAPAQVPAHAPDFGTRETLISIDVPPKQGSPFSATVLTTWTRLLEDGTTVTVKNHRLIARDSTGRIFQERRFLTPTGDKQVTQLSALEYIDPDRHEFYSCNPRTHLCLVSEYNRVVSSGPVETAVDGRNSFGTIKREDLGRKSIDNVEALGSREVLTVNPSSGNGYQKAESTLKEFWFSPQLDVNLVTMRFEPRGGSEIFTLQDLNLNEPDPRLFVPPADYKIAETRQR